MLHFLTTAKNIARIDADVLRECFLNVRTAKFAPFSIPKDFNDSVNTTTCSTECIAREYVEAVKSCHTCTYRHTTFMQGFGDFNSHVYAVHTNVYAAHIALLVFYSHNKAALSGSVKPISKINRELKILESGRTTFVGEDFCFKQYACVGIAHRNFGDVIDNFFLAHARYASGGEAAYNLASGGSVDCLTLKSDGERGCISASTSTAERNCKRTADWLAFGIDRLIGLGIAVLAETFLEVYDYTLVCAAGAECVRASLSWNIVGNKVGASTAEVFPCLGIVGTRFVKKLLGFPNMFTCIDAVCDYKAVLEVVDTFALTQLTQGGDRTQ